MQGSAHGFIQMHVILPGNLEAFGLEVAQRRQQLDHRLASVNHVLTPKLH